jgi:C_GCAxxG_C_C family probable redox protein
VNMNKKAQAAYEKMSGRQMNCAQAVFSTFSEDLGIKTDLALSLTQGFGGGMYVNGICGAVSGAYLTMGLANPVSKDSPRQNSDKTRALINEFNRKFKETYGALTCTELLGYNLSNPDELAKARESGVFTTKCPVFVRDASKIVEDMLKA